MDWLDVRTQEPLLCRHWGLSDHYCVLAIVYQLRCGYETPARVVAVVALSTALPLGTVGIVFYCVLGSASRDCIL